MAKLTPVGIDLGLRYVPPRNMESAAGYSYVGGVDERTAMIQRALEFDLEMERAACGEMPIKSFENKHQRLTPTVKEFERFYRRPRYLLVIRDEILELSGITNLLTCFCMKFYAKEFDQVDPSFALCMPTYKVKEHFKWNNFDIAVVYDGRHYDFRPIVASLKEKVPHIPVLVFYAKNYGGNADPEVENLRREGYYAFNSKDGCYRQEFMDTLIAHALGKEGLEKLRISPLVFDS